MNVFMTKSQLRFRLCYNTIVWLSECQKIKVYYIPELRPKWTSIFSNIGKEKSGNYFVL